MLKKLLEPVKAGRLTLKNRIMFPPLTTGYEERDGSIGERSLNFYERLAKGGTGYIVIGDVAPVRTASPTRCISMIVKWHCRFSTRNMTCRVSGK